MLKSALITGITGQDGSYLAELLLGKGYTVHGIVRRSSTSSTERLQHLLKDAPNPDARLHLHTGDLGDAGSLERILSTAQPEEVYNLAAQSHVRVSFDVPIQTADTVALGAMRLLEAIRSRQDRTGEVIRYYQASSSEMFGGVASPPQNESTPFHPRSPYAVAKVCAHWATVNYREAFGLHASTGILFNHESPRRGETFVTRKITRAVGRIQQGLQDKLFLGNLEARRDWGFAGDYVEAMWRMLQRDDPGDFVVATGESHSVREFLDEAFGRVDIDWRNHVEIDPSYLRPADVEMQVGDASKAREELGWRPQVDFRGLVRMMVDADMELAARERKQGDLGSAPEDESAGTGRANPASALR